MECSRCVKSASGGWNHRITRKKRHAPRRGRWKDATMPSTHFSLQYHIVFSTKDRAPILTEPWRERLHAYPGGIVREMNGVAEALAVPARQEDQQTAQSSAPLPNSDASLSPGFISARRRFFHDKLHLWESSDGTIGGAL